MMENTKMALNSMRSLGTSFYFHKFGKNGFCPVLSAYCILFYHTEEFCIYYTVHPKWILYFGFKMGVSHRLKSFLASCLLCRSAWKKWYFILPHAANMAFILQLYYQLRLSLCFTTHILLTFNLQV